jgi:Tol biopolymer transport system component
MKLAGAVVCAAGVIGLGVLTSSAGAGDIGPTDAGEPAVSANGRFVAFTTGADLGGPVHPAAISNIYVYDRERNKVSLVSRRSHGAGGGGANGASFRPEISADGRFVAFVSQAGNLSGADEPEGDVFVYDRKRRRVELISRQSKAAGGDGANGPPQADVSISANGRYVGLATNADNLGGPIDPGAIYYVYVYDRKRDRIQLVSRRSKAAGGEGADDGAARPSLSANGRFVAFDSGATNLSDAILQDSNNAYVYDRKRKRVSLVSRQSAADGGAGTDQNANTPQVSADGRFVAFTTGAENLGGPIDPAATTNVYVYDLKAKRVSLVSRQSAGAGGDGGNGDSRTVSASGTGRFIAFETSADNLGGPAGDFYNVYVYDRKAKRVSLASRRSAAAGADEPSFYASISGSGRIVAFQTTADNLGGPRLAGSNVYAYDRERKRVELISRD